MTILVGTCSWTGRMNQLALARFGTSRPTAEQALRLYSEYFKVVEVDSTFYALPSSKNSQLWVRRTPDDFLLHAKTFSLFSAHGTEPRRLPADIRQSLDPDVLTRPFLTYRDVGEPETAELWRRYREGLEPLRQAGKLGFILMQFSPSFIPSAENAEYILSCKEMLPEFNIAVEFRHPSWFRGDREQRVPAWLERNNLTMVTVDTPQGLKTSMPVVPVATSSEAYVRLHGRNAANWGRPGGSINNAHDYWYNEEELTEWLAAIHNLEQETDRVHVLFNTVQGLQTARTFQRLESQDAGEIELPADTSSQMLT